ncbi:MAG TPA: helix-turn-helix transcriptional regulator [Allosphingosinicella sp.]|jgi:DNA-binding XRE family transcriptional regulator
MSASASTEFEDDWQVVRSDRRGRCAYRNLKGSSVTVVDFTQNIEPVPPGFGRLDDLLDEFEADPALRQGLADARREVAAKAMAGGCTLAMLRLAQGLSQTELADALGTTQPAVSRMEAGNQEPRLAMLRKLAAVLKVDLNTLDRAFPS